MNTLPSMVSTKLHGRMPDKSKSYDFLCPLCSLYKRKKLEKIFHLSKQWNNQNDEKIDNSKNRPVQKQGKISIPENFHRIFSSSHLD